MAKGRKPRVKVVEEVIEELAVVNTISATEESNECVENLHPEEARPQPDCESTTKLDHNRYAQVLHTDLLRGMVLTGIGNTCSMFELGNANSDFLAEVSKRDFEEMLRRSLNNIGKNYRRRAILYNCTAGYMKKDLKRLGFVALTEYKGYSDANNVTVFIKKTTTSPSIFKKSFWERLFS